MDGDIRQSVVVLSNLDRYFGKVGYYAIGYCACSALEAKRPGYFSGKRNVCWCFDAGNHRKTAPKCHAHLTNSSCSQTYLTWCGEGCQRKTQQTTLRTLMRQARKVRRSDTPRHVKNKATRTTQVWNDFHSSVDPKCLPKHHWTLPFRVAQLFD